MNSNQSKSILIIDDDETMKEALILLFESEGYAVNCLASGHALAEWLNHHGVDIIIIDYLMPGPTGAEIAKNLRQRKDTADIPIVMIAATPHYERIAFEAGVDKYIVKPFEIDYLLRQVKYYLSE